MSGNDRIAKNTIFLYFRMLCTIVVSLYTSRIILQTLGVNDYGIYQTVGGVAGLLSYIINGSLASGSSRFITFEMGRRDKGKLSDTFSSLLTVHLLFGVVVALLAETIGLWFLYNKLVIPPERFSAAVFTYHLSILMSIVGITQVPYTAVIIGHEKMNIYAYTSIIEAILKLLLVYILMVSDWDKLMLYASLLFVVQCGITFFYRYYCIRHYEESHYHFSFDKSIIKKVLGFSSWNLVENTSISLNAQGTTILLNMFFNSGIVTGRSVANIVSMTANSFVNNFRTAANPQIVKRFSVNDFDGSKHLLLISTKYSYFLMLILAFPVFLVAKQLLYLWLGQIPDYSVVFLQFAIVTTLFGVFDQSFYSAFTAKGQIKETTICSICVGYLSFPVIYVLFKLGYSPVSLSWVMLFSSLILAIFIKPFLLVKIMGYTWTDIFVLFKSCIIVTVVSVPIPLLLYIFRNTLFHTSYLDFFILSISGVVCVALAVWFLGLDDGIRKRIQNNIKIKLLKRK